MFLWSNPDPPAAPRSRIEFSAVKMARGSLVMLEIGPNQESVCFDNDNQKITIKTRDGKTFVHQAQHYNIYEPSPGIYRDWDTRKVIGQPGWFSRMHSYLKDKYNLTYKITFVMAVFSFLMFVLNFIERVYVEPYVKSLAK